MANYYATARTNYVTPTDKEALEASIEGFDIEVSGHSNDDKVCLISGGDEGWSLSRDIEVSDLQEKAVESQESAFIDDDTEEFSFEEHVMPFVKEGEVLVAIEVGNEKHRYVVGVAQAFVRDGVDIESFRLSLDDVYKLAAEQFNKSVGDITTATY